MKTLNQIEAQYLRELPSIGDDQLLTRTDEVAWAERKMTTLLLHHLSEIQTRLLFSKAGYPSLFEYVVKRLKMSESSAYRRIAAMRLIREFPEVKAKIESGALSLSVAAQAQAYFRQEKPTPEEKLELLARLEGKTSRQAEREIAGRAGKPLVRESIRPLGDGRIELKLILGEE